MRINTHNRPPLRPYSINIFPKRIKKRRIIQNNDPLTGISPRAPAEFDQTVLERPVEILGDFKHTKGVHADVGDVAEGVGRGSGDGFQVGCGDLRGGGSESSELGVRQSGGEAFGSSLACVP